MMTRQFCTSDQRPRKSASGSNHLCNRATTVTLDDRYLARKWFLRRERLARERGEPSIRISLRLASALRAILVPSLGAREDTESAA
ncbi:MAG TPA: hypothetical protein VFW04_02205 [Gemmatimonadaceae bacterium]|nr:hypothetical protein [Gemmatimonadaceae bacterium]